MALEYTVWAKSPSLNQEIRLFNLEGKQNNSFTNKIEATRWASTFAMQMNKKQHMRATDWAPLVKHEEVGPQTFINYQNSLGR